MKKLNEIVEHIVMFAEDLLLLMVKLFVGLVPIAFILYIVIQVILKAIFGGQP